LKDRLEVTAEDRFELPVCTSHLRPPGRQLFLVPCKL
jgi:hypothetical protein